MRAGEELESRALEHISKKYSFNFVKAVEKWTRALPSDPTFLAATLDGLTTTGIIVEVKFVHNFMDVITPAGATKKCRCRATNVRARTRDARFLFDRCGHWRLGFRSLVTKKVQAFCVTLTSRRGCSRDRRHRGRSSRARASTDRARRRRHQLDAS